MSNGRILAVIGVVLALALAAPAAATSPPVLRVRTYQPFALHGARFKAFERVTVTLEHTWVRYVQADSAGSFTTTFRRIVISRCDGFSAKAIGSKGSRAALNVRPVECPSVSTG